MNQMVITPELSSTSGVLPETYRKQLKLLLETPEGTVFLDRGFGLNMSFLDSPPPVARSLLAGQLAEKMEQYIPDLELVEVHLEELDRNGNMRLKVVVDYAGQSL